MATRRMNLGPTPEITLSTISGDVEARGRDTAETILDTDGKEADAAQSETGFSAGAVRGDCALRLPQGAKLHMGSVAGQMRVKAILGGVSIETVGGDFASRCCGSLTIGGIGGDADLRETEGEIALDTVGGDLSLRECASSVRIGTVGGDCSVRDVPAGIEIENVGGDLEMRTAVQPGAHYAASAGGDLEFRFPSDSSLRIVLPASSNLRLERALKAVTEGDHLIVTIGDGEATAELSARGALRLRFDDEVERGGEYGYVVNRDFDTYMTGISAQIDSHMRGLEQHMGDLPERIRRRVERKVGAALREVESAQRHARRSADRASSGGWAGVSSSEPVSEEERLAILKMLEEGKISVQEAQNLLSVLEGES